MRVSGGVLGGRRIETPKGVRVRPTQDRVRQALFSSLAARVPAGRFLDLFAGSGAVGIEAWSRGAAHVTWVERDPRTAGILRRNVDALCRPAAGATGGTTVVVADALRWLARAVDGRAFDFVFVDPPYDRERREAWSLRLAAAIEAGGWLATAGLFILEQAADVAEATPPGWTLAAERRYGEARLWVFKCASC